MAGEGEGKGCVSTFTNVSLCTRNGTFACAQWIQRGNAPGSSTHTFLQRFALSSTSGLCAHSSCCGLQMFADGEYDYQQIKNWVKKQKVPEGNVFLLDKLIVPGNVTATHWTCTVAYVQQKVTEIPPPPHTPPPSPPELTQILNASGFSTTIQWVGRVSASWAD